MICIATIIVILIKGVFMEFFTVLPIRKYVDKKIAINDSHNVQVGFIQRKYRNFWDKLNSYSFLSISFLETTNIIGESNGYYLKIKEQSFKANLIKLKWNIYLSDTHKENKYLLEDKTKVSTNPRMVYHKNNKEYLFKKDIFNRTCEISINDIMCATITMYKKIPLSLKTVTNNNDLTIIELLGIYYIINLVY